MNLADLLGASAVTAGISLVVGLIAFALLVLLRRAHLLLQLTIAIAAGVASVVLSMIAVADEMYLSAHDSVVAINVAIVAGLVSTLVGVGLCVWIARSTRRLSRAVERLGLGEEVPVDPRPAPAEIADVEAALAETSRQLRESRRREARIEASRRELVAWISHDLRTPLAGMQAMAEALEDGLVSDPHRYYRQMRASVELLSSMVDDLFELSKIDAGTMRLTLQEVSLLDVVSDAVADLRPATGARVITIDSALAQDVVVRVDPAELARAIGNLVMNAVQHTPATARITVRTELIEGRPTVSVIDTGGGIDAEDLPRLFEPGWRGSAARTPRAGTSAGAGAGLGLAIVRGIVDAHQGEVAVTSTNEGCRFDIRLPADAAVPA